MNSIVVVDYGMGNLRSVAKALGHVAPQAQVQVSSDPRALAAADRVVFPGQGAMPDCMRELESRGLRPALLEAAANKPFLGICIGLQMLFQHSEEGDVAGLGLFEGAVRRFAQPLHDIDGGKLKVPHMGWNEVRRDMPHHPLWQGIDEGTRFYFVHSYYPDVEDSRIVAGTTCYPFRFTCAVARANIFAVQFHPEKSQAAGLALLRNFTAWDGQWLPGTASKSARA
jgi:imidazole glycerol-phosphate synthase subunit HisH